MRFKEFTDIDSLRHAKVDEKPVKNSNSNNFKYVSLVVFSKLNLPPLIFFLPYCKLPMS